MSNSSSRTKLAAEVVPSETGSESIAHSAAEAIRAYLATPLQRQARWQEKLNTPFQRLFTKPKPTEAEIREAQQAYQAAFEAVTKEVEYAGKEMKPQPLLPGPSTVEELDILFDEPLTLADIHGPGSGAKDSKIRQWAWVAAHVFEPSNYHPDGRDSFGLATWGREPATTTFFGSVSAATTNGGLFLHNAVYTDPTPGAAATTMRIWAGVGALLIPQLEKGWLRVRTVVTYNGTGTINMPPRLTFPIEVRADNMFGIRMVVMSTPVTETQWRTEWDLTLDKLSQGWTSPGGTTLGGTNIVGLRADQELLVSFDRAGGPPRIYALWVLGEDEATCGSRPEVINSVDVAMNCTVGVIRVDELVRRNNIFF